MGVEPVAIIMFLASKVLISLSRVTSTSLLLFIFAIPLINSILLDLNKAPTPSVSWLITSCFLDIILFKSKLTLLA